MVDKALGVPHSVENVYIYIHFLSLNKPMKPGDLIHDRYRIEKHISRDEVGYLFRVLDTQNHDRPCLLKLFAAQTPKVEDLDRARERFIREATILKSLQHHNLPKFLEVFRLTIKGRNSACLVSEIVEGKSYRDLLLHPRKKFTETDVIYILDQALQVLDHLHTQRPQIIHRNLTLDTLIKTPNGVPTLTDFSLSRCINEFDPEIISRVATPGFSPPEQSQGEVSPSTDLYALGVIAICLLTGQVTPQKLKVNGQWNWQPHVPENLNPKFVNLINGLIAQNPKHRSPSARLAFSTLIALMDEHKTLRMAGARKLSNETLRNGRHSKSHPIFQYPLLQQFQQLPTWIKGAIGIIISIILIVLWSKFFAYQPSVPNTLTASPAENTRQNRPDNYSSGSSFPTPNESPGICRDTVLNRGEKLGIRNWDEVDRIFSEANPEMNSILINPLNPNHRPYIKSWCDLANQWMDSRNRP